MGVYTSSPADTIKSAISQASKEILERVNDAGGGL